MHRRLNERQIVENRYCLYKVVGRQSISIIVMWFFLFKSELIHCPGHLYFRLFLFQIWISAGSWQSGMTKKAIQNQMLSFEKWRRFQQRAPVAVPGES